MLYQHGKDLSQGWILPLWRPGRRPGCLGLWLGRSAPRVGRHRRSATSVSQLGCWGCSNPVARRSSAGVSWTGIRVSCQGCSGSAESRRRSPRRSGRRGMWRSSPWTGRRPLRCRAATPPQRRSLRRGGGGGEGEGGEDSTRRATVRCSTTTACRRGRLQDQWHQSRLWRRDTIFFILELIVAIQLNSPPFIVTISDFLCQFYEGSSRRLPHALCAQARLQVRRGSCKACGQPGQEVMLWPRVDDRGSLRRGRGAACARLTGGGMFAWPLAQEMQCLTGPPVEPSLFSFGFSLPQDFQNDFKNPETNKFWTDSNCCRNIAWSREISGSHGNKKFKLNDPSKSD